MVNELGARAHNILTTVVDKTEDESSYGGTRVESFVKPMVKDKDLRTKVLTEVNLDYHDAQLIANSLNSGMIEELVKCFEEDDTVI